MLRQRRPDRFAALVPELLRADRSWITRPAVYEYLHERRQDLLTPFLGRQAYRGRFATGKTRFVLPVARRFERWSPRQQATFARTLGEVLDDRERDTGTVQRATGQLAALPAVGPEKLIALAADDREAVRDTALMALGGLDAGQGVEPLVAALGDERARVAIYALRRAVLTLPAERAVALLRRAPLDRVTVAKEVVRLLGEIGSDEAYQDLLALDAGDLHRDVRVALLRALWGHLERAETWPVLERAAASADPALAAVIARIPADGLSRAASVRLATLLSGLARHPEARVRLRVLGRGGSLPLADARRVLLPALLDRAGSSLPDERTAAAAAVFNLAEGDDAALIGEATARLLADRRVLVALVGALGRALARRRTSLRPIAEAVLLTLSADRLTDTLRASLAVQALPPVELARWLEELAASDAMHSDVLSVAHRALQLAGRRTGVDGLELVDTALGASEDERLRRLGLAALVGLAEARGWDEGRLARLRAYRDDPSPLVASAAQFTLPPAEEAPAQRHTSAGTRKDGRR
jgi:HEAT repeat protein